ncbi:type II toxin-antitoxin system VapC family toxin [Mariniblastus sp.]|nr:type II toxin-antitoxin system VapC family toxin [Mariniblastus sp.]
MIILDTDHIVTLKYSNSERFKRLAGRMADSTDQDFVTTTVTLEEQMRGWLAQINRKKDISQQVLPYAELAGLVDFFSLWTLVPFDKESAKKFQEFRKQKIRTGSMDLKIASIAVSQNCLLLTANTRDFEMVPGIQLADWIN